MYLFYADHFKDVHGEEGEQNDNPADGVKEEEKGPREVSV